MRFMQRHTQPLCYLAVDGNVQEKNGCCGKRSKLWDSLMQARGNAASQRIYRSKACIEKENERWREEKGFVIHPFSAFRFHNYKKLYTVFPRVP